MKYIRFIPLLAILLLASGCGVLVQEAFQPNVLTDRPVKITAAAEIFPEERVEQLPLTADEVWSKRQQELPSGFSADLLAWLAERDEALLHDLFYLADEEKQAVSGQDWWFDRVGMTFHCMNDLFTGTAESAENIHVLKENYGERITLAFTGDVCLADDWENMLVYRDMGADITKNLTGGLLDTLNRADITLINNEFCYSLRGKPLPYKLYTFRADPANVSLMQAMGADIVSLANNHCYDFGPEAFADTLTTLRDAGIPYVGAGENLAEACTPQYFVVNGMKIAYVASTRAEKFILTPEASETSPGVLRAYDPAVSVEVVKEAEKNADIVIVYPHWGTENSTVLEDAQLELAELYVEAGADLIVGAHPHCLQGMEYIGSCPVIFSLGNFWFNTSAGSTALLWAELDYHTGFALRMIPCRMGSAITAQVDGTAAGQAILDHLARLSPEVNLDEDGWMTPKNS